jgi:3'-phosphoadenosine 5'-phosphosulfate sulfotransferase (PAPS reductase)/FAD synthetase
MNGGVTSKMNIFEQQMAAGALYAKLRQREHKLAFAISGIEAMMEIAPKSYASISFGKQSICLAHMLYQIQSDLPMYFLASWESWIIHNYDEVIAEFLARWSIDLHIVQTDNVSDDPSRTWKESRDLGQYDLQNMCDRADWDGWYWGLTKEESVGRLRTLSTRWQGQPHSTIFRYTDGKYRCCPLMEWNAMDIAAYITEYDLPMLDLYKSQGLEMRTTARVTRDMAEMGGVAYLRHLSVERLNKLAERFPEVRRYV